jgi:23S rRNA pseudouridine1911/1915/1917 synthase
MIIEEIPPSLAGERLDRVAALITGYSRTAVRDLIDDGRVLLNGAVPTERVARVALGDEVTIDMPDETDEVGPAGVDGIDVTVIYEDDHIIVVDKQAGLVVHPGAGHTDDTLVNGLLALYPELTTVGQPDRPGIVHRLDRDTTGLLVVARSELAYEALVEALSVHDVHRRYVAVCWGSPETDRGVVDAPIGRSRRTRTRMAVAHDGKHARTHYEVVQRFTEPVEASLVSCELETGRTHQIRVHLAAIGAPVMGDEVYGRPDRLDVGRVQLHAAELGFVHPATGEPVRFESPWPPDFAATVARFS